MLIQKNGKFCFLLSVCIFLIGCMWRALYSDIFKDTGPNCGAIYLHVRDQLTEAPQEAVGHWRALLLVFILRDGTDSWSHGQQSSEKVVSEKGVLGKPLGLAVQVAQERGQHGDVGWFSSITKHNGCYICFSCSEYKALWANTSNSLKLLHTLQSKRTPVLLCFNYST